MYITCPLAKSCNIVVTWNSCKLSKFSLKIFLTINIARFNSKHWKKPNITWPHMKYSFKVQTLALPEQDKWSEGRSTENKTMNLCENSKLDTTRNCFAIFTKHSFTLGMERSHEVYVARHSQTKTFILMVTIATALYIVKSLKILSI